MKRIPSQPKLNVITGDIPVPKARIQGTTAHIRNMKVGQNALFANSTNAIYAIAVSVFGESGHVKVRKEGVNIRVWRIA